MNQESENNSKASHTAKKADEFDEPRLPGEEAAAFLRQEGFKKYQQELQARGARHKKHGEVARGITEALQTQEIEDYEPCHLSDEARERILERINQAARKEPTLEAQQLWAELYLFLRDHSAFFTELSHGTTAELFDQILVEGIKPYAVLKDQGKLRFGEGARASRRTKERGLNQIPAGVGLGGLGTAIAYAEFTADARQNERLQNILSLHNRALRDSKDPDLTEESRRFYQEQLEFYKEELRTPPSKGKWEFPVVLGFDHSQEVSSFDNPKIGWVVAWPEVYKGGEFKVLSSLKKERDFKSEARLDSEVYLPPGDEVPSEAITLIACPKDKMEMVRRVAREFRGEDISFISLEALELLPKIGVDRVDSGYKTARSTTSGVVISESLRRTREDLLY
ncbi:hypothetical protein HYS93_00675 [Candidatus Daviesbacteria bacterium]|nr:hypothetical protein [Candidatus Daviesbacteria bacterium]